MHACPGPDRHPRRPNFTPPPGAYDCHAHVFGPPEQFPYAPVRSYTPEPCPLEEYLALLDTLGFDRGVIVHGGAHGTDNRVTLDALARAGDRLRAVLVTPPGASAQERAAWHAAGVRGYRMSTVVTGGVGFDALEALDRDALDHGWHLVCHFNRSHELAELAPRLQNIGSSFVLDHLGRVHADDGPDSPGFQALLRLLDTDRCWVKLASLYRLSSQPYPHADILPLVHAVVRARPDRVIWGSNWPHPICPVAMPNDGDLVDLIPLWVPDAANQQRLLVDNPAQLYDFPNP